MIVFLFLHLYSEQDATHSRPSQDTRILRFRSGAAGVHPTGRRKWSRPINQ